jgi:hypothetical protein
MRNRLRFDLHVGGNQARDAKQNKMQNEINISDINSAGIAHHAKLDGITTVTLLGDNGKSGDARVTVYQFGAVRVANTNGDPVWEEQDRATFAELLENEGIAI